MKKLSVLLLFVGVFAQAESTPGVTCSTEFESSLPLMNTALHNIYSFDYVRGAMAQLRSQHPDVQFCISGIALSRNIYTYPKFYIQVSAQTGAGKVVAQMRFLFQDASTQALDNVGAKPWIGLAVTETQSLIADYTQSLSFAPVNGTDLLAIAKASSTYTACGGQIDFATLGAMPVEVRGGKEYFIVSWLTQPGGNPYSNFPMLKGVMISRDTATGAMSISENLWLTQALDFPMQTIWEAHQPAAGTDWAMDLSELDVGA